MNPADNSSEAAEARRVAYDRAVKAIRRVDPKAAPVAGIADVCGIPRVVEQARRTVAPPDLAPSSEQTLRARVSRMQNDVAHLVAKARRAGVPAELPVFGEGEDDPLQQLQKLNGLHDALEKRIRYFDTTTQEQRAIDDLRAHSDRLDKRLDAIAAALTSLSGLLPLLMPAKASEDLVPDDAARQV